MCAIKDVFSNRIVGYSIDSRMTSRLAVAALTNAVARREDVAGCILHTDRGSQFRSRKFVRALGRLDMVGSMGSVGAAGDNAAMESFFSLLQKRPQPAPGWPNVSGSIRRSPSGGSANPAPRIGRTGSRSPTLPPRPSTCSPTPRCRCSKTASWTTSCAAPTTASGYGILLGDPDGHAIALRGHGEQQGGNVAARTSLSLGYVRDISAPGFEGRMHDTTLYTSIYRADNELLANIHVYGSVAGQSPVLHVRRLPGGRVFDHYMTAFDKIRADATPVTADHSYGQAPR